MSVRIHKLLGYGLTDIKLEDGVVFDPRLNPDCVIFEDDSEVDETHSPNQYFEWLTASEKPSDFDRYFFTNPRPAGSKERSTEDYFVFLPRGDMATLVIQPMAMDKWKRSFDDIDYITETYLVEKSQADRVDILPDNIHPFTKYVDVRTGQDVDSWYLGMYKREQSRAFGQTPDLLQLDEYAQRLGFIDHDEALLYLAPKVPFDVRNLADFLGIFRHENSYLDLRPMLFTYWA
jgi:hypothetical protein